ncbi:MAG: HEAT repeat domain-containing protein [Thermoguttaceae bacterium]
MESLDEFGGAMTLVCSKSDSWRPDHRHHAVWALRFIGPRAKASIPVLIDMLMNKNWDLRRQAFDALQRIGFVEEYLPAFGKAMPALIKATADDPNPNQSFYCGVMRNLGSAAVPGLAVALTDRNRRVRRVAAVGLREIGQAARSATTALIVALNDDDARVRLFAAQALIPTSDPKDLVVPPLIQLLKDKDYDVRYFAADALRGIGPAAGSAAPALLAALKNGNLHAGEALYSIDPEATKRAVPQLVRFLRAGVPPSLRANAAALLSRIDPAVTKEAVPALIRVLKGNAIEPLVRGCVAFMGSGLIGFKSQYWEDDRARGWAAHALGFIGPSPNGTMPALKEALEYQSAPVRNAAACALLQIGRETDAAVSVLLSNLKDKDWHVRIQAAQDLLRADHQADTAISVLEEGSRHDEYSVSQGARSALNEYRQVSDLNRR